MISNSYRFDEISSERLLHLVAAASASLVRLDERITNSAVGKGYIERSHFMEACASLWVDGELIHLEELVLHDAGQDTQAPSHTLTIARDVLKLRRRIASEKPERCLEPDGVRILRGQKNVQMLLETKGRAADNARSASEEDRLAQEIAHMDALLARSEAIIKGHMPADKSRSRTAVIYDEDWDEDERLRNWCRLAETISHYPPPLQAAILLDAWREINVFQHQNWLGRLLSLSVLRKSGLVSILPTINIGMRQVDRDKRAHKSFQTRLYANLEALVQSAEFGLKEHHRLMLARRMLERRLIGRRSSSKLADAIECVLSYPVVSTQMIAQTIGVTPRAALRLIEDLNLREVTGRGRFRAWGIL